MKEYNSTKRDSVDEEDEMTVKQIIDGFEKMDQWNSVSTPNLEWFQRNVELEQKRMRRKQRSDLITFIFVAAVLLSVVIAFVYHQPILFLYFQLIGIVLLPLAFYKTRKRVSNE